MFSPAELYDRIVEVRRREGLSASAACEKLAVDMERNATAVWKECGAWFLREVERRYFRVKGFENGGQCTRDAQDIAAPEEASEVGGHRRHHAHRIAAATSPAADNGSPAHRATDAHNRSVREPSDNVVDQPGFGAHQSDVDDDRDHGVPETTRLTTPMHASSPGTPWYKKIEWRWDVEISMPHTQRQRLADVNGADLLVAENVTRRTGRSYLEKADTYRAIREMMKDDTETLQSLWERTQSPQLKRYIRALLANGRKAA